MIARRLPVPPASLTRLGVVLALLALALRVVVPAGWMPAPASAAAHFAITICDGGGGAARVLTVAGREVPRPHGAGDAGDNGHMACPFAGMGLALAGGDGPGLAPVAVVPLDAAPVRSGAVPPAPRLRWRPPGRAPPIFA